MASQLPVEEASKESSLDTSPADDLDVAPPADESTPGGEQAEKKKAGRKRRWEGKEEQGEEGKKRRAASPSDRPSRERKSVERFAAMSPRTMPGTKTVAIQQGSGEKLGDIPNVAFKLSKLKADENLRVLHRVLFGRKGTAHYLKRNILQFSGFVLSENEKEKSKVQEKLNKLNKDRLLYFCKLLDIYSIKVNTKKEDISAKLLEFLESPHITREVILAEKDKKGKKRKRGAKKTVGRTLEVASSDKQRKKKKTDLKGEAEGLSSPAKANKEVEGKSNSTDKNDESSDEGRSSDEEETSGLLKSKVKEEKELESELTKKLSYEGLDEKEEFEPGKNSPALRKVSHAASKAGLLSPTKENIESETKAPSENNAGFPKDTKGSSKKSAKSKKGMQSSKTKKNTEGKSKTSSKTKASSSKDAKGSSKMKKDLVPEKIDSNDNLKTNVSLAVEYDSGFDSPKSKKNDEKKGKSPIGTTSVDTRRSKKQNSKTESTNKGKEKNVSVVEPSSEQLSAAVGEMLKEVDFNVTTLADIIRQLGAGFDTDLMHRKAEIKQILHEAINSMTDDEEEDDGNGEGGAEEGEKN